MALKGQIEKKESVTGKIHGLGYNEIQELKAEMQGTIAEAREATADAQEAADVIFTEFNTITKESDLFSVENGVYYNNVGERTEHSKYTSYHLRAESDFEFFFEGVMELLNQTEISTGSLYATVFSNGVASRENARVTENFSTEGHTTEFPWKMGMAISVKVGELFVISLPDDFYYHNGVEFVKGFSCRTTYGEAGMVMADGVQFGKDQVAEVKRISLQVFSEEEELLLDPPNLFPASFELWNSTGAILDQSVGAALLPSSREPSATYRIPITPGRSYVFTPTPAGGSNDCFFAVGDKNGICLDFVTESVDSYEVKLHYNGAIPAYIYYGVEDINNVGSIVFKDGRIGKLQRDVDAARDVAQQASNALNVAIQEVYDYINSAPAARIVNVALPASEWIGSGNLYSQVVNIEGITERSQVDLTPSVEQLSIFYNKDLAFVTENEDGIVTVYSIGQKPSNDYTIQATVTEVNV